MKAPFEFNYAVKPPGRKTPRIRGRIRQFILAVAARRKTLTWHHLAPLSREQAIYNLRGLALLGKLRVVRAGKRGGRPDARRMEYATRPVCGRPAVYAANPMVQAHIL